MENIRTPAKTVELTGRLLDFKIALESEIDEIKKSGQSSTLLTSGRKVTSNGADYWYCYKVEYIQQESLKCIAYLIFKQLLIRLTN